MATSKDKEYEVYSGVSTADVPNAAWGWSELPRSAVQLSGWGSVIFLLALNFGNHEGHVETIWLLALAALIAIGLIIHAFQPELSKVRTITAYNRPEGHVEPDWSYNQKTLSGPYAELTDSQLRALNIEPSRVQHLRVQAADSEAKSARELDANS